MTTYTVECAGFTGSGLPNVKAVQGWVDSLKAAHELKGEEVRIYKFVDGMRTGASPEMVGTIS